MNRQIRAWSGCCLVLVGLATGCSKESPATGSRSGDSSNPTTAGQENNAAGNPSDTTADPRNAASLPAAARNGTADGAATSAAEATKQADPRLVQLQEWTQSAMAAEREFRFADALATWQQVHQLLLGWYGKEDWRVRNCELAIQTAERQIGFDADELERFRQVARKQESVGKALAAGDYANALQVALQAAPETKQLFGADSWMTTLQTVQVARLHQLSGAHAEAIAGFREASAMLLKLAGPIHPELEKCHGFLAESFAATGDARMSLANLKKAASLSQSIWGDQSLQFAARANELGVAYNRERDFHTAIRVLQASETIRMETLGENHPLVAHSRLNLSISTMGTGDLVTARKYIEAAETVLASGAAQPELQVACLRQKSALLMLMGDAAAAEPVLRQLVEFARQESKQDGGAILAEMQYRLAICLARQDRADRMAEAISEAQASLASWSRLAGPGHERTNRSRDLLASLYERIGDSAKAAELGGAVQPAGFSAPAGDASGAAGTSVRDTGVVPAGGGAFPSGGLR